MIGAPPREIGEMRMTRNLLSIFVRLNAPEEQLRCCMPRITGYYGGLFMVDPEHLERRIPP